jgi:hypothetical protein
MGHVISKTAEHRPALRRRRFRHDNPTALDLFSGFGGFTQGIEAAGFDTIVGANHNPYKVEVHEANHPHVEHWQPPGDSTQPGDSDGSPTPVGHRRESLSRSNVCDCVHAHGGGPRDASDATCSALPDIIANRHL